MILLEKLRIKDFAIVAEIEVEFASGFTVVTGETGAGKSLLLGAFTLLIGERASSDLVRSGCKRALIEAQFSGDLSRLQESIEAEGLEFEAERLILAREIGSDGKSRCLVNDQRVNLTLLRELGQRLCDLHGQHQHQWLLDPSRHLWFLDRFAGCSSLEMQYRRLFEQYCGTRSRISTLEKEIAAAQERRELYSYQLAEIESAAVKPDEEDALETEQRQLENVARIKRALFESCERLETETGALAGLAEIERELRGVASSFKPAEQLRNDLESAQITLSELNRALAEEASRLEEDPARLEEVADRLSLIYELKRKYGGSLQSLEQYHAQIREALSAGEQANEELSQLQQRVQAQAAELIEAAIALQREREQGAAKLARRIKKLLAELGMPDAGFEVEFLDGEGGELVSAAERQYQLSTLGLKQAQFLFSANPGEPVKPLARIASGGEISRVMLALKSLIAGGDQVDLLLFDEVDAGIGGSTATLVGKHLRQLAQDHQVIAITHLQQIAAYADHHYRAAKKQRDGRSESYLEKLDDQQRLVELGRMISGGRFGEEEKRQAKKLLASTGHKVSVDTN
ncbi:MAG: DNA repair protein RecN [bacterium]